MNDDTSNLTSATTAVPLPRKVTKNATVLKLLSRSRGASLAEIMNATCWQSHSTRAFLSGLRKKSMILVKEARKDGETSYRLDH